MVRLVVSLKLFTVIMFEKESDDRSAPQIDPSHDDFDVTRSTYSTTKRSCLVSKYVSILEKQQDVL